MTKELRNFLLKFPYLSRPRIIKEGVEVPSRVINSIILLLSFPPWWPALASSSSLLLMAGGNLSWSSWWWPVLARRRRRERWFCFLHPLELGGGGRTSTSLGELWWPKLARKKKVLGGSHLGRSLPTQRPRLEEEYGRRSRGLFRRYN